VKTFIAALIIFALLCALVFCASAFINKRTHELISLAHALPATQEELANAENLLSRTHELAALWARSMALFPYMMSYDMLDRADDAALSLCAAAESDCTEDFISARLRFIDAVSRLACLLAISAASIA
jgi:hypothetical protein